MSDRWFIFKNYSGTRESVPEPPSTQPEVDSNIDPIAELNERINNLDTRMERIETKLDKLINSHKSLISYFSAMNDNNVRDLNYKIRGYSSKTNQIPPVKFVPERHCDESSNDA